MSFQGRIGRAGCTRIKRALGVQAALEWAFRVEQAQLELPVRRDIGDEGFGFGMEYVLLQRAALGCKVDDRYLPVSAISNTIRDSMLARGLVTTQRLRERGVR